MNAYEANIVTKAHRIVAFEESLKNYHYSIEKQILEAAQYGITSIEVGMGDKEYWKKQGFSVSDKGANMEISWANPKAEEED